MFQHIRVIVQQESVNGRCLTFQLTVPVKQIPSLLNLINSLKQLKNILHYILYKNVTFPRAFLISCEI